MRHKQLESILSSKTRQTSELSGASNAGTKVYDKMNNQRGAHFDQPITQQHMHKSFKFDRSGAMHA